MSAFTTIVARWLLPIRRSWAGFVDRLRLDRLPAVPTVCLLLCAGILIPLQLGTGRREAANRASSIAAKQLHRFASSDAALPDVGPAGATRSPRPAFHWPIVDGASRYVLDVRDQTGRRWLQNVATEANYFVQAAPSELAPGQYRFTVKALDDAGRTLDTKSAAFSIETDAALAKLRREIGWNLPPFEAALKLAGYHASRGSASDVLSALLAARAHAPKDQSLRHSLESLTDTDAFAGWLAKLTPAP